MFGLTVPYLLKRSKTIYGTLQTNKSFLLNKDIVKVIYFDFLYIEKIRTPCFAALAGGESP